MCRWVPHTALFILQTFNNNNNKIKPHKINKNLNPVADQQRKIKVCSYISSNKITLNSKDTIIIIELLSMEK